MIILPQHQWTKSALKQTIVLIETHLCDLLTLIQDMKFNDAMPKMKVDPESYRVEADGVHMTAEPAETVAVAQGYYIY